MPWSITCFTCSLFVCSVSWTLLKCHCLFDKYIACNVVFINFPIYMSFLFIPFYTFTIGHMIVGTVSAATKCDLLHCFLHWFPEEVVIHSHSRKGIIDWTYNVISVDDLLFFALHSTDLCLLTGIKWHELLILVSKNS